MQIATRTASRHGLAELVYLTGVLLLVALTWASSISSAKAQDFNYNRPGQQFTYFIVGFAWTPTVERVTGSPGVLPADYYTELRDRANAHNAGVGYFRGCADIRVAKAFDVSGVATVLGNARYVGNSLRLSAVGTVPMQAGATFRLCGNGGPAFAGLSLPREAWGPRAEVCFELVGRTLANATVFGAVSPFVGRTNMMCSLTLPRLLANRQNVWAAMPWAIR